MNRGPLHFEIQADRTERATDFDSKVFGWKFSEAKGLPVSCSRIETGGARGGLPRRSAKAPTAVATPSFALEVEDSDATPKTVAQLEGISSLPGVAVPNPCWQGYFVHPEGNADGVCEVDESAGGLKRWHRSVLATEHRLNQIPDRSPTAFLMPCGGILTLNAAFEAEYPACFIRS